MQSFLDLLKPLKLGQTQELNIKDITKKLKGNESKLAEHFQFSIYEFCSNKKVTSNHSDIIKQLVDLCYSHSCLSGLNSMERFVGCLASMGKYFIEKGDFIKAIDMSKILDKKKENLTEASVTSKLVRDNLFIIHHHLVEAAVKQSQEQPIISQSLLDASLCPLEYISIQEEKLANKVKRNIKSALNFLKLINVDKVIALLKHALQIIRVLCGGIKSDDTFENYFALRICSLFVSKTNYEDIVQVNTGCKNDITVLLLLSDGSKLLKHWYQIIDYFTTSKGDVETCVAAVKTIMKCTSGDGKKRACLIISSFFNPELWTVVHDGVRSKETVEVLFNKFVLVLWDESSQFRNYFLKAGGSAQKQHVCLLETLARCFITLSFLCRSCFKDRTPGFLNLVPMVVKVFKLCNKCLIEMPSNECDSTVQAYFWSHLVVRSANSVEDLLGCCLNGDAWVSLRQLCCEIIPTIAVSKRELPIEKKRLALMFDRWHMACSRQDDYKNAMLLRALQICTCSWDLDEAILSWAKSKVNDKDTNMNLLFLDYLKTNEKELRRWIPELDSTKLDNKTLLMAEAKAYQAIGSQDVASAMMEVWAKLKVLRPNIFESAHALSCVIVTTVNQADPATLSRFLRDCRKLLGILTTLKETDRKNHVRCLCYEGILKFAIFSCSAQNSRSDGTTTEARLRCLNFLKEEAEEKAKFGDEVDMNLTCDVVPESKRLTVKNESDMVEALESALSAWQSLPEAWTTDCLLSCEVTLTLEYLNLIANTAALYGVRRLTTRAWVLYYQIAELVRNRVASLTALSRLTKECGVSKDSKLLEIFKNIANQLVAGADVKKLPQQTLETLLFGWLSLAHAYLSLGEYQTVQEFLALINGHIKLLRSETDYLMLKGQYLCIVSQLLCAAPELANSYEVQNVQRIAYNAFHHLRAALKAGTDRSLSSKQQGQLLLTMLDVSLWCADLFHTLLLTPYVRSFLEDLYSICQALRLTGRTAQILSVLVQVDLTNRELIDAQLKLSNLIEMLELPALPVLKVANTNTANQTLQIPSINSNDKLREVSPVRCYRGPVRDTSPLPMLLASSKSNLRSHPASCNCYKCCSSLLQLTSLTARSSEALAFAMSGDMATAVSHYQHCDALYSSFDVARYENAVVDELDSLFPMEKVFQFKRELGVIGARVKLTYAAFTMLPESHAESITDLLLTDVGRILSKVPVQRSLLEWSYLELQICAFVIKERKRELALASKVVAVEKKYLRDPVMAVKTPHISRTIFANATPRKIEPPSGATKTPVAPPKRGRRIFDEEASVIKPPTTSKNLATPAIVRHPPPISAVTSIRATRLPKSVKATARRSPPLVINSSDSDVPATPSPEIKSVRSTRAAKVAPKLKPVPIFFDESKDKLQKQDISVDLFDSFEQKLKISEPTVLEKKKPKKKKTVITKKEVVSTKNGPSRTARI